MFECVLASNCLLFALINWILQRVCLISGKKKKKERVYSVMYCHVCFVRFFFCFIRIYFKSKRGKACTFLRSLKCCLACYFVVCS